MLAVLAMPDSEPGRWVQPPIDLGISFADDTATYGHGEVLELTKVTPRQIDHWVRQGIFVPSVHNAKGSGTRRLYSFRDLLALRVLKRLVDTGVAVEKVGRAVQALHDLGENDLASAVLVSDGHTVYQVLSDGELTDLARGGQGVFLIAVKDTLKELREDLARPAPVVDITKRRRRQTD